MHIYVREWRFGKDLGDDKWENGEDSRGFLGRRPPGGPVLGFLALLTLTWRPREPVAGGDALCGDRVDARVPAAPRRRQPRSSMHAIALRRWRSSASTG